MSKRRKLVEGQSSEALPNSHALLEESSGARDDHVTSNAQDSDQDQNMDGKWTEGKLKALSNNARKKLCVENDIVAKGKVSDLINLLKCIIGEPIIDIPDMDVKADKNDKNKRHRTRQTPEEKEVVREKDATHKREVRADNKENGVENSQAMGEEFKKRRDLTDYESLQALDVDNPDFSKLSPNLQVLKKDIEDLLPEQLAYFLILLAQLHIFVRDFIGGAESFFGSVEYYWNTIVWVRILINLSKFKVDRSSQNDCCFSLLACRNKTKYGRPSMKICNVEYTAAVILRVLFEGPLACLGMQASHLCHNPLCVFWKHVKFESSEINGKRSCCKNGSASTCECPVDRCVWVRNGEFLECRNIGGKAKCSCGKKCFGALNLITPEGATEQQIDKEMIDTEQQIDEDMIDLGCD